VTALKVRYFDAMLGAVRKAAEAARDEAPQVALRRTLSALLTVKRENIALAIALRAPMAELDGAGFVRETLSQFAAVLAPAFARSVPHLRRPTDELFVLLAAFEGAISYAVFERPESLSEEWFLDDLVALGAGFAAFRGE